MILLGPISALPATSCLGLFQSENYLTESESLSGVAEEFSEGRQFPNLWNAFRGIPLNSSKAKRPISNIDTKMMATSYRQIDPTGRPRETGKIRILDRNRNVITESGIILGSAGKIAMNENIFHLIKINLAFSSEMAFIEITHTHPTDYKSANRITEPWKFSNEDFQEDLAVLQFIREIPALRHVALESYILYLSFDVEHIGRGFADEDFFPFLRLRGYRITP